MKISSTFERFVEQREGFRPRAYRDTGGRWTIGFGHLIRGDEPHLLTALLTREDAVALLRQDVATAEEAVNRLVKVPLRQEQYDALVSFTYNVGQGSLARSTLLHKLNDGYCCAVPDELRKYVYDNGKKVAGLIARRNEEVALYVGDYHGG